MYALVSNQGTACGETALCNEHYTPMHRLFVTHNRLSDGPDAPIPDDWHDCTGNDALECIICGKQD